MKKYISLSVALMLLTMGIAFVACQENQVKPVQEIKISNSSSLRGRKNM